MGMYDEIKITCPACKETFTDQSKRGPCKYETYTIHDAPLSVLDYLLDQSREGILACPNCERVLKLRVSVKANLIAENQDFEDWRTLE